MRFKSSFFVLPALSSGLPSCLPIVDLGYVCDPARTPTFGSLIHLSTNIYDIGTSPGLVIQSNQRRLFLFQHSICPASAWRSLISSTCCTGRGSYHYSILIGAQQSLSAGSPVLGIEILHTVS